jgi:hypothetical protein
MDILTASTVLSLTFSFHYAAMHIEAKFLPVNDVFVFGTISVSHGLSNRDGWAGCNVSSLLAYMVVEIGT